MHIFKTIELAKKEGLKILKERIKTKSAPFLRIKPCNKICGHENAKGIKITIMKKDKKHSIEMGICKVCGNI